MRKGLSKSLNTALLKIWRFKHLENKLIYYCTRDGFVRFDALCRSQQFFSHVRTNSWLPGLNQYYEAVKLSLSSSTQQHSNSASSES